MKNVKFSRYNNYVFYDNYYILHNGVTSNFLLLEQDLYDLLNAAVNENNLEYLQEIHKDFYDALLNEGFLVDNEKNELQDLLKEFHDLTYDDSHFEVHINPTMNCNFKCWYCYETHIKKSRLDEKTIKKIQLLFNSIVKDNHSLKTFQLNWFGGEPLLYFDSIVEQILGYAYNLFTDNNVKFNSVFTSNGLLINNKVIEACKKYNVNAFQITLDGHKERHDKVRFVSEKRGSYDEIVKNIKMLVENEILVNVRINCSSETLDGLEKIAKDFTDVKNRQFIMFDFHDVWQNEKKLADNILVEYMDYFRMEGFFVQSLNLNTFRKMCYADRKNMVNINYDGNLYKCTARDFTEENSEGVLGESGDLIWNYKHEVRLESKYKNPPCLKCSYLPICGSGCSQLAVESKEEYCVYDFDENKKKKMLLDNFLGNLSNTELMEVL